MQQQIIIILSERRHMLDENYMQKALTSWTSAQKFINYTCCDSDVTTTIPHIFSSLIKKFFTSLRTLGDLLKKFFADDNKLENLFFSYVLLTSKKRNKKNFFLCLIHEVFFKGRKDFAKFQRGKISLKIQALSWKLQKRN